MGLEDADLLDDGDGGGKASSLVSCSICLEAVTDNGDRSWSKLHCGHQFHLDCIGSAFNVKGVMQCPNCRKIEKGQWLFANGCRSFPEFNMDDWAHDEDLYDLSYSEMNDDVAELEWLSKFVEDSFSNYPQINVTGTSPAPSNTTTWTSTLESVTPTVAKSKPHVKTESTKIKREVYSSSTDTSDSTVSVHIGVDAAVVDGAVGAEDAVQRVRYKSGRLVPEYRPAESLTFVLTRHSNSHRKVMKLQRQKEMHEEGQHQRQSEVAPQLYGLHHHRNYESFGVHWCPFSGLTRVPSLDEGEFSSTAYHDLLGQPAIFAEHAAVSSATHPCPYIAYIGPVHPSSSNSNSSVAEGPPTYNNQWNSQSTSNEIPNSYAFPTMDVHYQSWEHHSSPFPTTSSRLGVADQSSIPSMTQRASRATSDRPRSASYVHPFLVGQSSAARAPSSVGSSMIPPYPGSVARARDRVQALQAYFQQPSSSPAMRTPIVSGTRRSSSHRAAGIAQVGPVASSSDQSRGGFYFFPSSGSSTARSFQEAENPMSNPFHHAWEREPHLSSFPASQVDRDQVWGPFHQPSSGSDNGVRSTSFRQRHGSERMPSQSHHHRS